MSTIFFDTREAVITLKNAGIEESQADAIVKVLSNSQNEVSTKSDLIELKYDLIKWMLGFGFAGIGIMLGVISKMIH